MNSDDNFIDPEVRRKLDLLQDTPPREPEIVNAGRRKFLSLASSMKKPVSISTIERLNKWFLIRNKKERRSMFSTITTIVVAIVMIFGGASATVYAAQDSTPEDLLYSVKTWSEDAQLSLTNNPQSKFNLVEEFILRRFVEVDSLLEDEEPIPPGLVTRLENQLKYMLQLGSQLNDEEVMQKALIRVRSMLQEREQLMINQEENVQEWVNPAFTQIQQMLNERIRRIETEFEESDPLELKQQMESPTGGFGPGPGTGSGNPEVISPTPTGQGEVKPSGPCDPAEQDCGSGAEPEYKTPVDPHMNSGETSGQQQSGDSSKQEDKGGSGNGSSNGGKP